MIQVYYVVKVTIADASKGRGQFGGFHRVHSPTAAPCGLIALVGTVTCLLTVNEKLSRFGHGFGIRYFHTKRNPKCLYKLTLFGRRPFEHRSTRLELFVNQIHYWNLASFKNPSSQECMIKVQCDTELCVTIDDGAARFQISKEGQVRKSGAPAKWIPHGTLAEHVKTKIFQKCNTKHVLVIDIRVAKIRFLGSHCFQSMLLLLKVLVENFTANSHQIFHNSIRLENCREHSVHGKSQRPRNGLIRILDVAA
mmetsp:Transcript_499/g.1419  ORF Transcript_499/g.1419 Transcript_499/m.1419 type:complete len:252 (-) Transcript_499:1096-1851(-)